VARLPQLRRSWYIALFQLPALPEWLLARRGFAALEQLMVRSTRPGALTDEDLGVYRAAWRRPRALAGMLAWYRAAVRYRSEPLRSRSPAAPTLLVWGKDDPALGYAMAGPSVERCARGRLATVEGAGHFVQHDAPETVTSLILDFLGPPSAHGACSPR
jgi:pimeloyl-ACP methyl ester carboxylesterase